MAQLPAPRISACAGAFPPPGLGPFGPAVRGPPSSLATCGPAGGGAFSLAAFFAGCFCFGGSSSGPALAPEALSWLASVRAGSSFAGSCAPMPNSRCQNPGFFSLLTPTSSRSARCRHGRFTTASINLARALCCLDLDRREVAGAPSSFALHEHLNMPALRVHKMALQARATPFSRKRAARLAITAPLSWRMRAAGVPGRAENGNTCRKVSPQSSTSDSEFGEHRLALGGEAGDEVGAEHHVGTKRGAPPRRSSPRVPANAGASCASA